MHNVRHIRKISIRKIGDVDEVMARFPAYAVFSMENGDLVFGSNDTLCQLRHDPMRGYYPDRDDYNDEDAEDYDIYLKEEQYRLDS